MDLEPFMRLLEVIQTLGTIVELFFQPIFESRCFLLDARASRRISEQDDFRYNFVHATAGSP